MERREQETSNVVEMAGPSGKMRSMIDVTFRMKKNDMFGKKDFKYVFNEDNLASVRR